MADKKGISHQRKFAADKGILTGYFSTFNSPTCEGASLENEESKKIYQSFQDELRDMAIKYIHLTKDL